MKKRIFVALYCYNFPEFHYFMLENSRSDNGLK